MTIRMLLIGVLVILIFDLGMDWYLDGKVEEIERQVEYLSPVQKTN
jgi:hypothetical protein